jgi:hypothetical protein
MTVSYVFKASRGASDREAAVDRPGVLVLPVQSAPQPENPWRFWLRPGPSPKPARRNRRPGRISP